MIPGPHESGDAAAPGAGDGALAWIPGGAFRMGSDAHYPEEAPSRTVEVGGFWMSHTPVTNDEYGAFVAATGYVTVAERPLDPAEFPGAPAENLVPGSMVFTPHHRTGGPAPPQSVVDLDPARPGTDRRGPAATSPAVGGIRWSTSPTRTPRPTRRGPDVPCRPRPSGSVRPAAGWTVRPSPGGGPEAAGERLANHWLGDFPWRSEPGSGTTTRRELPAERVRAVGHGRERVGVDRRLVPGAALVRRRVVLRPA